MLAAMLPLLLIPRRVPEQPDSQGELALPLMALLLAAWLVKSARSHSPNYSPYRSC